MAPGSSLAAFLLQGWGTGTDPRGYVAIWASAMSLIYWQNPPPPPPYRAVLPKAGLESLAWT